MLDFIDKTAANKLPVEAIAIDAGWYNLNGHGEWQWTGTWQADPLRYPRGMKPVIDRAHADGFKFSLWFEPERVSEGSWLDLHHPEWILKSGAENNYSYLLNLGDPRALDWVKRTINEFIQVNGLDIYRQDFNFNTTDVMWRTNDAPDRQGITEIKHIMGLYAYWDFLLAKNPDLLIDNCAGGGRRIDIETLRRSFVAWRSDLCWKSDPEQCINYGISTWLPITGRGSISTMPYDFRSGLGSFFGWPLNANDPATWAPARRLSQQYLKIRHLYTGDFYPLTPYSQAGDAWMAWQYNSPVAGQGVVQAFRRKSNLVNSNNFHLRALDANQNYLITDFDGATRTVSGRELEDKGLQIDIVTAPGSALIKYERLGSPASMNSAQEAE
jgi:alpha-galactosidase